jgi:hypothetical protein
MNFVMKVLNSNRNTNIVCPTPAALYEANLGLADGKYAGIEIRVSETGELLHTIPRKYCTNECFVKLNSAYHRTLNYDQYSFKKALAAMKREAACTTPAPQVGAMSQVEIAKHYGFHASRVAILEDFGFLKSTGKRGRIKLYLRQDVYNLMRFEPFRTYLSNVYERSKDAPAA